jgi:hypothetical protein
MFPAATSGWSEEQAKQFQQSSGRLHELIEEYHGPKAKADADTIAQKLKQTDEEVVKLREQLDAARNRPARIGAALRMCGIAISAIGAVMYFAFNRD